MKKVIFSKSPFLFFLILFMGFVPAAFAGKGAWVRIFNLTGGEISCTAREFTGFKQKAEVFNGTIAPTSAFPLSGPVYIESNNWIYESDLILDFSSAKGNPGIQITYKNTVTGYYEYKKNNDRELFVYSAIYGKSSTGTPDSSSQYVVNIFVCENNFTAANWMSQIDDDVNVADLFIPGTHNAATYPSKISSVQSQGLSIAEQLKNGIRYLDLRGFANNLYVSAETFRNRSLNMCDIQVAQGSVQIPLLFSQAIAAITDFLTNNPEETVLLQIKMDDGNMESSQVKKVIDCLVKRYADFFYTKNRIPVLKDARGKIILINRFHNTDLGFNVTNWPDNAQGVAKGFYALQDKYFFDDSAATGKYRAVTDFLQNFCSADNGPRLNLNFLNYTSKTDSILTPAELATGSVLTGLEGMNPKMVKYFNTLPGDNIPNYHAVMLMDYMVKNDGLTLSELFLNFKNYGKKVPHETLLTNNADYFIRPKLVPEKVLNINVSQENKTAVIFQQHPENEEWPWQHFTLEKVRGNIYRLHTTDFDHKTPLYLDAYDGNGSDKVVGFRDCSNGGCSAENQQWKIEQYGNTSYYTITGVVDNRRLDLIGGRTENYAEVKRYPVGGTVDHQLWLFEKIQ